MHLVNITVITWNRLALTRNCFEKLLPTIRGRDDLLISVVDNGSADGTPEYLDALAADDSRIRLWKFPRNVGLAVAANLAWAETPARYYVKVDNDIEILRADWLDRLTDFADKNDDGVMVGYCFFPHHVTEEVALSRGTTLLRCVNCNGGLCLIPSKVHQRCGFWNEDYGKYGHLDLDYSKRVSLAGFEVGYLENEGTARHLGYVGEVDARLEEEKRAVRSRDETGRKMYLLNCFLFEQGIRDLYVDRRYLPVFSGEGARLRVNPEYAKIIKLQKTLLEQVDVEVDGDMASLDFSRLDVMRGTDPL